MSYFEFPHTRNYDGDLGYIIKKLDELNTRYNNFFDYNAIKYHDPIEWNIATVYPAFNIVYDVNSAAYYIAKTAVPAGIDINNNDFWLMITPFKVDMELDETSINPVSNKAVTQAIISGSTATASLSRKLDAEIENRTANDNAISARVDAVENDINAETAARSDADMLINERIDSIIALDPGSTTGDAELADIRIAADGKTYSTAGDAVRAQVNNINQALGVAGSDVYELTSFTTGFYNLSSTITEIDRAADPTTTGGGSNFKCTILPCKAGDVFSITSTGSSSARNWAFLGPTKANGHNNIIARQSATYTLSGEIVIAPPRAEYIVINIDNRQAYNIIVGAPVSKRLEQLDQKDIADRNTANINNNSGMIVASDLLSGYYYDTATGALQYNAEWTCCADMIAISPDMIGKILISGVSSQVGVNYYAADKSFIDSSYAYATPAGTIKCIPANTAYITLSVHATGINNIIVKTAGNTNSIDYPFTGDYIFMEDYWCNNSGNVISVDTLDCICMNVTPGDKWYTNATNAYVFMCFDNTNTFLGILTPDNIDKHGRIYTVPAAAAYCYMNIPHANTHGEDYLSTVFYKLNGSKALCIGDSITWLDGETGGTYDNASLFLGYQKQLEKAGIEVTSAGFNGYPYAMREGTNASIYEQIVTGAYDVSGFDFIILAGGTNDDVYGIPVGVVPDNYNHSYTSAELYTMAGALNAIIAYIRENNTTAKIILCTQHKSQATERPFTDAITYRQAIINTSIYASCKLCDIFSDMNVQPFTDEFDVYYYDNTHPNRAGMERMGTLILNTIKEYLHG